MRIRREDVGLAIGLVAGAVLLIGVFVATGGEPPEETVATTAPQGDRVVRTESTQVPAVPWSTARAAFAIRCDGEDLVGVDARVTRLPRTYAYTWRAAARGGEGRTIPLANLQGLSARLVTGRGNPEYLVPDDEGVSVVRFDFTVSRSRPAGLLVLSALNGPTLRREVLSSPRLSC